MIPEIILFLLCSFSLLYCCDLPVWFDCPLLVADKDSMLYGLCLSIAASCIFYLVQTKLPQWIAARKNKKLVFFFLSGIHEKMSETISILSGTPCHEACREETVEQIKHNLAQKDIFTDGARVYRERSELVIIDALHENQEDLHREIQELFALHILDQRTTDLLLEIENLYLRKRLLHLFRNKEGNLSTVAQARGNSLGGALVYNKEIMNRDIASDATAYIAALQKLEKHLQKFYR